MSRERYLTPVVRSCGHTSSVEFVGKPGLKRLQRLEAAPCPCCLARRKLNRDAAYAIGYRLPALAGKTDREAVLMAYAERGKAVRKLDGAVKDQLKKLGDTAKACGITVCQAADIIRGSHRAALDYCRRLDTTRLWHSETSGDILAHRFELVLCKRLERAARRTCDKKKQVYSDSREATKERQ